MVRKYHSEFHEMDNLPAPSVSSSKNNLDLLLLLSQYSSNTDIPETCDLSLPDELDSHFQENYKSWLHREVFLNYDIFEEKII